MVYEYRCSKCEEVELKEMSMAEEHPKSIVCGRCGAHAFRVWGNSSVKIPEYFKATSDICNSDNAANLDYIKNRMKHGTRPSGREKIYW